MRATLLFILITFFINANANECKLAFEQAKELESLVNGIDFITETEDTWHGFASIESVKNLSELEIRRVLNLGAIYDNQESFFHMDDSNKAYEFIQSEIEHLGPEYDREKESQDRFKKLLKTISAKYKGNIRLIQFGNGDLYSWFVGYHMIVLIDESGCILGLKALTVWT
jgi:hypothetical protein